MTDKTHAFWLWLDAQPFEFWECLLNPPDFGGAVDAMTRLMHGETRSRPDASRFFNILLACRSERSYLNDLDDFMVMVCNAQPFIGMGATLLYPNDRYPYTVIEIVPHKNGNIKHIIVQEDDWKRTDRNGMSESQSYDITPNPNGKTLTLKRGRDGHWYHFAGDPFNGRHKTLFQLGSRRAYFDPHI